MYNIDFEVTGNGEFPMDMLRYDGCHPTDTASAHAMHTPRVGTPDYLAVRTVRLRITSPEKTQRPTRDRWASFMWAVGSVRAEKL